MQLWLGEHEGLLLGIFTDMNGLLPGTVDSGAASSRSDVSEFTYLCHVSSLQKCFSDGRLPPLTGMQGTGVGRILDEVPRSACGPSVVLVVDGEPVDADTLTYRGLDFVMGHDVQTFPFVMLRPSGHHSDWPALRSLAVERDPQFDRARG